MKTYEQSNIFIAVKKLKLVARVYQRAEFCVYKETICRNFVLFP